MMTLTKKRDCKGKLSTEVQGLVGASSDSFNGNSCPHLGHFAPLQCTNDSHPEQAKALPYDMSKAKPHSGQRTIRFA